MTAKNIKRAVLAFDGVIIRDEPTKLFAMVRGYDVEFDGYCITMRKTANRKHYDAGSDYNPGGYMFLRRIKDLTYHLANI